MKTLQEIKDEVAKKHGYSKWDMFIVECAYHEGPDQLEMMEEVVKLFAQEACREQREICAAHYNQEQPVGEHYVAIRDKIKNAPKPKMI